MEIYKTDDPAILEKYFAFTPTEFLNMVRGFEKRVPAVAWDDAGIWLYYMDYAHPIIKKISKMMQMVRTRTSSVIFTTPMPTLILGKLRNFPQTLTIKILKETADIREEDYNRFVRADFDSVMPYPRQMLRRAKAYRSSIMPDLQKLRVHSEFIDKFGVLLPDPIYEWYSERRRKYVRQLEQDIEKDLPKNFELTV